MSNASRIPRLSEVIREHILSQLSEMHIALPGRVESYDPVKQMASIQPVIKQAFIDEEGARQVERLPVIPGVPVQFPQGGGYRLTFPIAAGDSGLLVFSETSLDVWLSVGGEVDPLDDRRSHLTDAIFIPGVRSFAAPISDAHQTKLSLGKESGPQLFIGDNKIQLGGETSVQGAGLGENIEDYLLSLSPASLRTWLQGLATAIGYLTPYPSLATLKSSIVEVKP